MGWMETCAVDQRMRFVMTVEKETEAFAAVCRRFGVSRKTGCKWLERFQDAGVAGLPGCSHNLAPMRSSRARTLKRIARLKKTTTRASSQPKSKSAARTPA